LLQTLAQLLPFVLGGAFLPTWTSQVIVLLGTDRPLTAATSYVTGNATWRFILGFAAIFVVKVTAPEVGRSGVEIPVAVAWTAALLLAGTGAWLLVRRSRIDKLKTSRMHRLVRRLKRIPPLVAFGYGAYACALPGAQWAYFLGGCGVIASAGLSWEWQIVLLVVFVALLEVMLAAPIVVYARNPEAARARFDRLEGWLGAHATSVVGVVLLVVAALCVQIALTSGHVGGGGG
jgi:hypothetical protein